MKPKLGRPKLPKDEARNILMVTRVNTVEEKQIKSAVKASKTQKTVWMRNALLSAASGAHSARNRLAPVA